MAGNDAFGTARTALAEKRHDDAIDLLTDILSESPDNSQILSMLGAAYAEAGDYAQALTHFSKALAITPSARNHFNVAIAHRMQGDLEQAEAYLCSALEIDPEYERAKDMLSEIKKAQSVSFEHLMSIVPEPIRLAEQTSHLHGDSASIASQFGDPSCSSVPYTDPPRAVQQEDWGKLIPGGIMVGLGGMILWVGWASAIFNVIGGVAGGIVGFVVALACVLFFCKWLAESAGELETHHWIIMILITGLIPSLLIIKGLDLLMQGYYGS
ncbi:MAG: tetratricopeptide repeat protein [Armatimonadota bacterium]|nr:tetratricopeptide repeat protein [bacterium]